MRPSLIGQFPADCSVQIGAFVVWVSVQDREFAMSGSWSVVFDSSGNGPYFARYRVVADASGKSKNEYLHRAIASASSGDIADHRDGDTLNNRRSNLRLVTVAQSNANRRKKLGAKSAYKGVEFCQNGAPRAAAYFGGRRVFYARAKSEREAALLYDVVARIIWGDCACLNFPRNNERAARLETR